MTDRRYEAIHYPSADSRLRLFARDYPPTQEYRAGLPLLMMHGLTRNSADFEPVIDALAPSHRLIIPDQRGRGKSDYDPKFENYRPDVYVSDMWALLDRLGIHKVICVGTSMGGLMSMMMAAQMPIRIAGIVLNDVGPQVSEEGINRIRSYVGQSDPMSNWQAAVDCCEAIMHDAFDGFAPKDWLAFARRTCEELSDGSVRFAYDPAISKAMTKEDSSDVPPDLWPMWESLQEHPTLAIRGAKSDILVSETVEKMALGHTDNFSCVEVPGRGHAPILDEPEAVSAIRSFLAELK